MKTFQRILDAVFVGVGALVKALLLFMVVIITVQVFLRGTTGRSIRWAEEVSLIAMVWVTFLTMALGVKYDIHIRIDMFVNWLPRNGRIVLEYVLNVFLLFISAMMIYYGYELTRFAMRSTMPATRWPTGVVYGVVPLAGCICLMQILARLLGAPRTKVAEDFINGVQYQEDRVEEEATDQ